MLFPMNNEPFVFCMQKGTPYNRGSDKLVWTE